MKLDKICIVGGGSAGWMTAAVLVKHFGNTKDITLIESPRVPTIGVGESTTDGFNAFVRYLGLDDKDWMPPSDATYKSTIRFEGWGDPEDPPFHFPFGLYDVPIPLVDYYVWRNKNKVTSQTFQTIYSNACTVSEGKRLCVPFIQNDTAYQIDAIKFSTYLKDSFCIPRGVNHIVSHCEPVANDGRIDSLVLEDGTEFTADLFFDCTGFRGVLMEKLRNKWKSWHKYLLNNSTWAYRKEYTDKRDELTNYTRATTMSSGWMWTVPTWSRIGTGYNYSKKYQSKEDALKEFKKAIGKEDEPDNMFRHLEWPTGIREKIWKGNCIAIGLSGGFIEPLESGGLFCVTEFLFNFIRYLDKENTVINSIQRDTFNASCRDQFTSFRNFVICHYTLAKRCDTEYWQDAINVPFNSGLQEQAGIHSTEILSLNQLFPGVSYLMGGLKYNALSDKDVIDLRYHYQKEFDLEYLDEQIQHRLTEMPKLVQKYPVQLDYLKEHIYGVQ